MSEKNALTAFPAYDKRAFDQRRDNENSFRLSHIVGELRISLHLLYGLSSVIDELTGIRRVFHRLILRCWRNCRGLRMHLCGRRERHRKRERHGNEEPVHGTSPDVSVAFATYLSNAVKH